MSVDLLHLLDLSAPMRASFHQFPKRCNVAAWIFGCLGSTWVNMAPGSKLRTQVELRR